MNKAINTKYGEVIRVLQRFDSVDGWVDVGRNGVYNIRQCVDDHASGSQPATRFNVRVRLNPYWQGKYDWLFMELDFSAEELRANKIRPDWDCAVTVLCNQGKRQANLLAVDDKRQLALYEYAMPAGTTSLIILPADSECCRPRVSYAALPRYWFDLIRDQHNHDVPVRMALCGQSQNGKTYTFPETGYAMSWHENVSDMLDRQSDWF